MRSSRCRGRRGPVAIGRRPATADARGGPDRRRGRAHAAADAEPPRPAALEVVYRYRLDDVGRVEASPRALTVALRAEGETIGSLAAISRSTLGGLLGADRDALDGPRPTRRPGDRERAAVHRGARARRARFAHRAPQPPALLRVSRPRDRAGAALRALRLADRVRPRRLQAHQRPDRPSRRRRRARPSRRPRARVVRATDIPCRVGGRRVRDHPAGVGPRRRRTARRPDRTLDPSQKIEKVGSNTMV